MGRFKNMLYGALLVGLTGLLYMYIHNIIYPPLSPSALWQEYTTTTREIEGKSYTLVVADTPERWEQGLMYVRTPIAGVDGMIFVFPSAQPRTFWNKNTFVDLTLYWMREGIVVGTSFLPSIKEGNNIVTVSSSEPVDAVVEIME